MPRLLPARHRVCAHSSRLLSSLARLLPAALSFCGPRLWVSFCGHRLCANLLAQCLPRKVDIRAEESISEALVIVRHRIVRALQRLIQSLTVVNTLIPRRRQSPFEALVIVRHREIVILKTIVQLKKIIV